MPGALRRVEGQVGTEGGDTIREGQNFDQNRPLPEISVRVHGTAGYPLPVGFIVVWRIAVRGLVVVGLVGWVWRLSVWWFGGWCRVGSGKSPSVQRIGRNGTVE